MKDKSWIKIASIYVGTIIGAGFASGQEIMNFFGKFGFKGLLGILISTMLFCLIGSIILITTYESKINTYNQLLAKIFGKNICKIIDFIIILFLLAGYCIMLAGSGALFYEQFNINHNIGIIIMAITTFFTFIYSLKGLSLVNTIIVPFLLIVIVFIGGIVIFNEGIDFNALNEINSLNNDNFILSSITYVGYNMIPSLVILTSISPIIDKKKNAIKGGIVGGLFLGILSLFILMPCLILYKDISSLEIPMLNIASYSSYKGKYLYSIILWCAMFTTAIGNGFGFIKRISPLFKINDKILAFILSFTSIFLAKFGFSNLVSTIYPLFGYISLFILIFALIKFILYKLSNSH
ncbi:YkvI family membrane protein [Tepidibacter formicigenes]|jgi:uncharacterized membrane protein YkvI|uniref:Uncharacterized membrane protein YkvI n=1 Tax=Tepidibacter formicigenes DSM 15518 TaxID=1123349 RepID=A0A1M6PJU6_9FIRM|nr:GerAB/ArcD/ProY family transporter [Tepidibacter formicigenes]SHK08236.1 Uncharacterized membrane protein YkvI [Tepidibacter formicigenes DSM 15518]